MPGDASLTKLFRDYGQRWEIEHMEASARWVAVQRDGASVRIIGAHDLGALRYRLEQAERDDAGEQDAG